MPEGKLYICPTPIGNMADVSLRVLEALRNADVICAEDTRVTGKLLSVHGIEKRIERLDEAMIEKRLDTLVERIRAGESIAYCSDAGMPGVSDPGLRLVRAAQDAKLAYEVLPGPSALTTAYVASGFTVPNFFFGGFLPRKAGECSTTLESMKTLDAVLIFYESPKRLVASLSRIAEAFPYREVAVCRELTKLHEEVVRMPALELHQVFLEREEHSSIKGEIVVVIDAPSKDERAHAGQERMRDARLRAIELKEQGGFSNKDIARLLQTEFDIARNDAYNIAVAL
ncbi:MAG: 16S rRNA (cytidine(1402)-2'-O)-methyltransferase [Raoultibacter sp.]|jgi:16S rRNA (cytidine1402-2'-O)-methyltransferase